jgi:outer membrane protein OmpA-like peptidoglycan-associated protein
MIPNFLFDFNSPDLNDTSKIVLERLSNVLNRYFDFDIEINGYADNVGSSQYNEALSLKRAQAIENFLIGKNVKTTRMQARGFGAANPLASNLTDEGRQKNRRVTIRMYKRE